MDQKTDDAHGSLQVMLRWLDPDPDRAGQRYEEIRRRLIFIFRCRGCTFPDDVADECFDRVAKIISRPTFTYEGDPALYFYGVAKLLTKEHLRRRINTKIDAAVEQSELKEKQSQCLQECMSKLPSRNAQLIIDYYAQNELSKIEHRRNLAERFDMPLNALRIQTHRIRVVLRQCVLHCLRADIE